jgi:predicted DNA-binding transcriptional regulator AlpA
MLILRAAAVIRLTGLSRTTLWRLERQGEFPARVRLGLNSVGWREEEIARWINTRPRGRADSASNQRREMTHE